MQEKIQPIKGPIQAKVAIPGEKNFTLRSLLLAALSDGVSEISNLRIDDHTRLFINALYQLGIASQLDEKAHSCIIAGGSGKYPKKQATLWCNNTKSIAYFLLASTAATSGVYYFDGSQKLRQNSLTKLINLLRLKGVQFIPTDVNTLPCTLIGVDSLEGGAINFEEKVSPHLISALLMIAPYARSSFNFSLTSHSHYLDMTCLLMAEFGVLVHRIHQGQFMVPVPQRYQARDYSIEADFSLAAYFFAAAALTNGEITISTIKLRESTQHDIKFLTLLEKMGCLVLETPKGLLVKGTNELKGIEIKAHHYPNTFIIVMVLALFAKSASLIDYEHLTVKQHDRLLKFKSELITLGAHIESSEHSLKIFPSSLKKGVFYSDEARSAMAISLLGLKIPGIIIDHPDVVNKVFPHFFAILNKLSTQEDISA